MALADKTLDSPQFLRLLFIVNAAIPSVLLGWDTARGHLGANPPEYLIRTTGMLTLVLLVVTLSITPLMRWSLTPALIQVRRVAGLFTFFYACLHALAYSWFDKDLNPGLIVTDVLRRPFILLGMAAFTLMVPLAATSTRAMVRKLGGRNWKRLHRAIYLIAGAGVIHFYLLVRADKRIPLAFGLVIVFLLLWRVSNAPRGK
ncbi:MAG: sulfoxide reductase heme-binding subunit YedZ [Acidobacteria bacterium]|nr:sulfoxide reductase heme-binding subunit YedZ [Acidobacteriota bacterium]